MELLSIMYGVIFGIFLSIGDGIAISHRIQYGFSKGLVTWLTLVATPVAIMGYLRLDILAVGASVGLLLSLLMFFQYCRENPFPTSPV